MRSQPWSSVEPCLSVLKSSNKVPTPPRDPFEFYKVSCKGADGHSGPHFYWADTHVGFSRVEWDDTLTVVTATGMFTEWPWPAVGGQANPNPGSVADDLRSLLDDLA